MKQITVVVNDVPGVVADVSSLMAEKDINIENIDVLGPANVIILNVDKYDLALGVLRDHGFQAITEDALVIRLDDEPGALAKIALRFKDAQINIRSMRIIRRYEDFCLAAIVCDEQENAKGLIRGVLVAKVEDPE